MYSFAAYTSQLRDLSIRKPDREKPAVEVPTIENTAIRK